MKWSNCDKHSSLVYSIGDAFLYKVKAPLDRTAYRSRQLELLLLKNLRTKLTRQLMRFAWRTETLVLPDQKVAMSEQSQFKSHYQVTKSLLPLQSCLSHNAVLHSLCTFSLRCNPFFEIRIYHFPREFNIPPKKLTSWAQASQNLAETIAFANKRRLLLIIQIQEALWRIN